jgi:hypothetical protein
VGCCICPGLDAGKDLPLLEGIEEFVAVIGPVCERPVNRVLLGAAAPGRGGGRTSGRPV